MKRAIILLALASTLLSVSAQRYKFTITLQGRTDTVLYIGQHFRDQLQLVDSTRATATVGTYTFSGRRTWEPGMYTLVAQNGKTTITDFVVDRSRTFSISGDEKLTPQSVKVKGCQQNEAMFSYMAVQEAAKKEMDAIQSRMKDPAQSQQAKADEEALMARMTAYEATVRHPKESNIFFTLLNLCDPAEVPDSIVDKPTYYRNHYWDRLFAAKPVAGTPLHSALLHSPQLFSKLNYFFYGIMYYADSDTICAEIDRLAARIGADSAMLRYVFDHIEPRYFRSTKNIGWDAVWCHLASTYYLQGRCPWATEGTLHNMRYNYNRIRQSLIGAHGQELVMLDTTQIDSPEHWHSSHRRPERYVILWFWDPDCHHCQEQSAELKELYDSLCASGNKRFEVYAVGYEADVAKWVDYVRKHDFRWVNVGGTNVNIDYQEAYNVHGAPTMIILDENRDIIMNKVLPIKSLLKFLDNHEQKKR